MHVHFAEPRWLWAGGVACLALAALFVSAARRRARAVAALGGLQAATSLSLGRRRLKEALVLVGTASLFVALARPLAGFRWEETHRSGIDLMFAVDTSKSMLAADLRPDRLTRAKLAVRDLVRALPGERFGLIAFAGDAFVQAPMTTDEAVFEESLDALDTSVIPRGGTDLASAIRAGTVAMASEPDRRKVLILLSDGEDLAGEARVAAAEAHRHGLTIYTVGVGTPAGEVIAARDEAGQPVRSRLDEQTLADVARATGGAYVALGPSGRGLQTLYRTELAKLPRTSVSERWRKVYTERFQIPLAVGIGCLLLELVLGERRRTRWRSVTAAAAAALLLAGSGGRAQAGTAPDVAAYNAGTGAYRQHDFAAAQQRFQAATRAGDLGVQQDAYYDLGNARFRVGQATEKTNPAATIEAWKGALAAYDGALALDRNDTDALYNRDLVARRLAELEKQQKQNQQQKQPQNQRQQGQQDKQNQQQQSKGGGQQGQQQKPQQGNGQGQPQQAQQGQQQKPQQGNGQGQPRQAQQGQQQQRQSGAQGQPGQQPQPNEQASQPAEPTPRGAGAPTAAAERRPGQEGQRPGDERKQPGALSRGEADQLLDSLDGQMQRLPLAAFGKRPAARDEQPARDW